MQWKNRGLLASEVPLSYVQQRRILPTWLSKCFLCPLAIAQWWHAQQVWTALFLILKKHLLKLLLLV